MDHAPENGDEVLRRRFAQGTWTMTRPARKPDMSAVKLAEIRRVLVDIQNRVADVAKHATMENPVDLPKVVIEACIGQPVLVEPQSRTFVRVYYKGTDQSVKFDLQPDGETPQ